MIKVKLSDFIFQDYNTMTSVLDVKIAVNLDHRMPRDKLKIGYFL